MIDMKCVPTDDHQYLIDCTECGALGFVERVLVHTYARAHLESHGVDMADEPCCECGYNLLHPTGHPQDRATCQQCGSAWAGEYADHQAHHHWIETQHIWSLEMGDKR